ncbi:MAG: hypothetical protein ACOYYS_27515 [Chloroflexota bacterium]
MPFDFYRLQKICFPFLLGMGLVACSSQPQIQPERTPPPTSGERAGETAAAPITTIPAEVTAVPTVSAVVTLLPAPTALVPPLYPVSGIEIHNLQGVEQVGESGVYWIRRNALRWDYIEPEEGRRSWENVAGLEREMQALAEQGKQMILIVQYAPLWAQEIYGYGCGPVKADKLEAYAAFMHDVVVRYSAPPYNVRFFEMGNEPDVPYSYVPGGNQYGCWIDMDDPAYNADDYARMLQAVYPQVKAANPDAQLLVGGLLLDCDPQNPPQQADGTAKDCTPARFFDLVLQYGGAGYFDGVSFHAYDYYSGALGQYSNPNWHAAWNSTGPVLVNKARYLRTLLDFYHRPDAYLINTETALLCGSSGDEAVCRADEFGQTKAAYAVQSNTLAQAEGLWGNVWYSIAGWRASDLLDPYGQPLPVYQAIRFSAQQLDGMAYAGQATQFAGVFAYEFRREGRRLWVLWSQDGAEHSIDLPSLPAAAYDMLGNPLAPAQAWRVDLSPVYVEWQE